MKDPASSDKKDMSEFQEMADHLEAQVEKEMTAKKPKHFIMPPVPPEVKEIFSETNCNLLINLPFRCYEIVINAHKNKLSSAQKSILVHTFKGEQHLARRLVTGLTKMCVGSDPEYRLDFFREFEKWFEHLEHVFKKFLFQRSTFKSDLEFPGFDLMLEIQFWEIAENLTKLLNKFSIMSCVTQEKWEYAAKALENIGAIPTGTLESMEEAQAQAEELYKSEKMLEDAVNILSEKIKRFKDSQIREKTSKEQPWRDDTVDYMPLSEAIVRLADNKIPLPTLSKKIKPDGPMRYMRKGQRCRVHIADFRQYVKKHYVTSDSAGEIADEYIADIEAGKAAEKTRRNRQADM